MEVITIENKAYQELMTEIKILIAESKMVNKEVFLHRERYLTVGDVAVITGYKPGTIRLKKDEIGYVSMGGQIKFLRSDVDKWMIRYYIEAIK